MRVDGGFQTADKKSTFVHVYRGVEPTTIKHERTHENVRRAW